MSKTVASERWLSRRQLLDLLQLDRESEQRLREREDDPLPHVWLGGRLRYHPQRVRAWLQRQERRGRRSGVQ